MRVVEQSGGGARLERRDQKPLAASAKARPTQFVGADPDVLRRASIQ
eukprot:CAMPEP_0195106206 /NCGR_PEP_ID=MMETSP0448-20130528/79702_1 /TAXON_ID=66468 /ORGANISM="Heterocapsa triquestra, Strain CCMP 448" /LENGTH=46 /DNA_ID= /DNA_START= /DNA_END= /DNA_ORIENTATION=